MSKKNIARIPKKNPKPIKIPRRINESRKGVNPPESPYPVPVPKPRPPLPK